jgi:hypothetical protein
VSLPKTGKPVKVEISCCEFTLYAGFVTVVQAVKCMMCFHFTGHTELHREEYMTEDAADSRRTARYTVKMNGPWSVQTYGIVEFLRVRPTCRVIVGTLGVLFGLAAVYSLAFKIPYVTTPGFDVAVCLAIITAWLLRITTISGKNFELVFPDERASQERKVAEEQFDKSQNAEDALNLDLKRLNEYYTINQTQARSSFFWAIFCMLLGFSTIIVGIWIFYFRRSQPDQFVAGLSTAAGIVGNLISGMFLYLQSKTQERSLQYFEQLTRLQRLAIAKKMVDDHTDTEKKTEARNLVISELLASSRPLPQPVEAAK